MNSTPQVSVLFVCLGNICRSPTAHGIFEALVRDAGLDGWIRVDSAGTGDWHIGKSPDKRAMAAALGRGLDIGHLIARQVRPSDFDQFDYILAMDRSNLSNLERMRPPSFAGHLGLFLPFAAYAGQPLETDEVPDPYYGEAGGFQHVYELVEQAARGLLAHISQHHPRSI
ncbi:MAG: phosphotyrosine protein phosphatase [Porticoccaceae bacterium]|nr:phosphotyrosine protein phosphatase [Porticoccaceae bacterium]